ncbi:MAG: hypothetical protein R2792_17200 [Saprospiraceae bacterium]
MHFHQIGEVRKINGEAYVVYLFSPPLRGSVYLFVEIDDLLMRPWRGLDDLLKLFIRLIRLYEALFMQK